MSSAMFISRQKDSKKKEEWKFCYMKVVDSSGELIVYIADDHGMETQTAVHVCKMLDLKWASDEEIETYGVAFELAPIVPGAEIAAIEITETRDILTWGF